MKKSILCLMMVCICFVVDAQTKNSKRKTRKTPINTVKAEESQEEKTFKKYSLYFGIIRNQFSVDSPEKWNGLYYNYSDDLRGSVIVDDSNFVYVGASTLSADFLGLRFYYY